MHETDPDGEAAVPERVPAAEPLAAAYGEIRTDGVAGRGSNAVVHEARVGDRRVALKEPYRRGDGDLAGRFAREARTWSKLADHEGVVGVLAWDTDPHPWIALEYMDGGSLDDRGDLPLPEAVWVAARVAGAVHHAHRHGVAHLDLKPGNVLFRTVEGAWDVPKVADFGLARALLSDADPEGFSPPYAAPEQFDPDRGPADDRTDVYQLGALCYRLATGRPPYSGRPSAVMEAVLDGPPTPPTEADPSLPAGLDAVVERAMAPDREDRYESALDLRRDLETLLSDLVEYEPESTGRELEPGSVEAAGTGPGYGTAIDLERQGFVRLTPSYFERREPAPPVRAWRAGLRLVDVHHGYAVDRRVERDGERVDLSDHLVDRSADGVDHAVVGPPGSGKSTVLKSVACAWYTADRGPVFYRESGRGDRLDSPGALRAALRSADGHALVVVEDAVRDEASAVFEAMSAFEGADDVTFLLDAREDEWERSPTEVGGPGTGAVPPARPRRVEVVDLSRPDERELRRFVDAFERTVDRDPGVPAGALLDGLDGDGGAGPERPGALYLLIHRLVGAVDPLDDGGPTPLDDAVARAYADLADRGETALDVGVAATLLSVAGVPVHPELLHAVDPGADAAVAEAVEALDGRVLFDRDPSGAYRTVHETWATAFLRHLLAAEGERGAHERVGRVVSGVLALADDPERRDRVDWVLHGEAPYLDRVEDDPTGWADGVVEGVFAVGTTVPGLAPLLGRTGYSRIDLPAACSPVVRRQCVGWRGEAYEAAGRLDRAEAEFERLLDRTDDDGDAEDERLRRRALSGLGLVAYRRHEFAEAREHLERALELAREADDVAAEATLLDRLGLVSRSRDPETAREYHAAALERCREAGDRRGVGRALTNLGGVDIILGDLDAAESHLREAVDHHRAVGYREGLAHAYGDLSAVARRRGDLDAAADWARETLAIDRERGDRRAEAGSLVNLGTILGYRERRRATFREDGDPTYEAATEYFRRGLRVAREVGGTEFELSALINLTRLAVERGDLETARERLSEARELVDGDAGRFGVHLRRSAARIAVREGRYDEAEDDLEAALASAREIGSREAEGMVLATLARLDRDRDDAERARERFERTVEVLRSVGAVQETLEVHLELVDLCAESGDVGAAREHCERAIGIAEERGYGPEAETFRGRLAELDEGPPATGE